MKGVDKRKEERVPLFLKLQSADKRQLLLQSKDASISGVGIYSYQPLSRRENLKIMFALPSDGEPLEAETCVTWMRKYKEQESPLFEGGIYIKDMSALDRARWVDFVERQRYQAQSVAVYWEEASNLSLLKRHIEEYLRLLGKNISVINTYRNPFTDMWGVDSQGRAVLVFIYDIAKKNNITQIIEGLEWFFSQGHVLSQEISYLSLRKQPLLLIVAFGFQRGFLGSFKYLKPFPLELLQVSFIKSAERRGILARRMLVNSSWFGSEKINNDNSILGQQENSKDNEFYESEDYSYLDKEHQKIMRWLSKI